MKKIITAILLTTSFGYTFAQSASYTDIGLLISKDQNFGTARFESMGGAFGALGSDLSCLNINPAGTAVAKNSNASITLGTNNLNQKITYTNNTKNFIERDFDLNQAGGVLIFNSNSLNKWNRYALSFNYRLKSNFNNASKITGNQLYASNNPRFTSNPNETNPNLYNKGLKQNYDKLNEGQSSVFNLGLSGLYNKNLFIGASLNFHNFQFTENNELQEINTDINGNILDAVNIHESNYDANGISLSLGAIYKVNKSLRLGASYETSTYYGEIYEETNIDEQDNIIKAIGAVDIVTTDPEGNNEISYNTSNDFKTYVSSFSSPNKLTASGAYIFGKKGLISVDYSYKSYSDMIFFGNNFSDINEDFMTKFKNTHAINIGTEWRVKEFNLRAGYFFEENPNIAQSKFNKNNFSGYALGLGYNFGNSNIDISYLKSKNNESYSLYTINDLKGANNSSRVSATLRFNL